MMGLGGGRYGAGGGAMGDEVVCVPREISLRGGFGDGIAGG